LIKVENLTKRYAAKTAIEAVSFEVHKGEILGFLGPNGAGKTTTMRIITGFMPASGGTVRVDGFDVFDTPLEVRRRIGYLPESPPLYPEMNVAGYLRFVAKIKGVPKDRLDSEVNRVMDRVSITDVKERTIAKLSKGYKQRVGIAQALLGDPPVLILDEPTIGLDPNQIREIRTLIRDLGRDHSLILSTHILPEVEAVCDRVQILHRGEVVFNDTIAGLKRFRGGQTLQLGLRNPPPLDEIGRVAAGATVDAVNANLFRVHPRGGADPTDDLVRASVERGWGLFQLQPAQASLEEVFVQLTQRDEEQQEGVAA